MTANALACLAGLLATAQLPPHELSSDKADTCTNTSLAYYLVKATLDSSHFAEFEQTCKVSPEANYKWEDAYVSVRTPPTVKGLASAEDAVVRRLATPTFPKCDIYACPPGPCTVYDIDYQDGYVTDFGKLSFNLTSRGICGPAFNVQALNQSNGVLTPAAVDEATSESFPSLYPDGVLVFDPSTPGSAGLVPALGGIININPPWYYQTVPAWETASNNPANYNPKSCDVGSMPQSWPETTLTDKTPVYGDFTNYSQDKASLTDPDFKNVFPQTYGGDRANMTKFFIEQQKQYGATCDLSQCRWLPVPRPEKLSRTAASTAKYAAMHTTVNCIMIELIRAWLAPTSSRPTSCFGIENLPAGFNTWSDENAIRKHAALNCSLVGLPSTCTWGPFDVNFESSDNQGIVYWKNTWWGKNVFPTVPRDGKPTYDFGANVLLRLIPEFKCTAFGFSLSDMPGYNLLKPKIKIRHKFRDTSAAPGTDMFYQCFSGKNFEDMKACLDAGLLLVETHRNFKGSGYKIAEDYVAYGVFLAYKWFLEADNKIPESEHTNFAVQNGLFITSDWQDSDYAIAQLYEPLKHAVANYPPLVPNTFMSHNASILNDFQKSESAACNCNNEGIIYAYLDLPWFALPPTYLNKAIIAEAMPAKDSAAYTATALRESAYSWASDAGGDYRDGLPIGLYIPSSGRFGRNFITRERNFLSTDNNPGVNGLVQELADKYLFRPGSPIPDVLTTELLYNVSNFESLPYATRTLTYEYGACMKPPYGQVSSFEMEAAAFAALYHNCTDVTSTHKECLIREESLIGYCELVSPHLDASARLTYCFDDPLTYTQRQALCQKPSAKNIVLAQVLIERSAAQVCSSEGKTCLVIPEEPTHTLNAVMSSDVYGDLTDYTVLVAPFNWTVATAVTSTVRFQYPTSNITQMKPLPPDNAEMLGMPGVQPAYFEALFNQSKGAAFVVEAVQAISAAVNASKKQSDGLYDIAYLRSMTPFITDQFVYPQHSLTQVTVNSDNLVLRGGTNTSVIRVQPAQAVSNGITPCTFLYVAASNFTLDRALFNMTNCHPFTQGIDAAAVVLGGSNVSHTTLNLDYADSRNIRTPVVFAGDDTMHFVRSSSVNASNVTIRMAQATALDRKTAAVSGNEDVYDVAAARVYTEANAAIYIAMRANSSRPQNTTISTIEQLRPNNTLTWRAVTPQTNISRLNVSKYTGVYGDNVLKMAFPENKTSQHASTAVLVCSIIAIVFVAGQFLYSLLQKPHTTVLAAGSFAGTTIASAESAFGPVLRDTSSNQKWLATAVLRRRRRARGTADVDRLMEFADLHS